MTSNPNAEFLEDLVIYQAGSIVSKTLIKKDTGNVTLFAFAKGQSLSEHTAPFDALVYVIDGSVEILISGNPTVVKKGEMMVMPAGEPHALNAIEQFKMVLTMIKS